MRLLVSSESEGEYRFTVRTAVGGYEVTYNLSSGWRAQLQRLHWKAGNLLPDDDTFLAEVSAALKNVIFVEVKRSIWQPLLSGGISDFVIQLEPGSRSAALLPFELLSVDGQYLVDVPGLRIVRELHVPRDVRGAPVVGDDGLRILHVSHGTDPILELARERALLLNELPGVPVQFLMSPSLDLILAELNRFQPSVVHISSHGVFDTLREEHDTALDDESRLLTGTLLKHLEGSSVRVVFLASCQSALFVAGEPGSVAQAMEIAGFTFPVENDTARLMMATFYRQLCDGAGTANAISAARNANLADVFSSFSLVHYRPVRQAYVRFAKSATLAAVSEPYAFDSSEEVLLRLDTAARTHGRVLILSPVGFGARTLLRDWRRLQEQSTVFEVSESTETQLTYRFKGQSDQRDVSIVRFFEYEEVPGAAVVIVGKIGDFADNQILQDPATAQAVASVGGMAARIPCIAKAIKAGESVNNALQGVLLDNRLDGRLQALTQDARELIQELIGLGGTSSLPLNPLHGMLKLSGQKLLDAQGKLKEQRIAVELEGHFVLSPEIMFLADGLFPGWRKRNEEQLQLIAGAFATVHRDQPLTAEQDFSSSYGLLQWSSNLARWDLLHELILICQPSYSAAGRSTELIPFMELARDHLLGEERMIHEGNLSALRSHKGTYAEGLKEQRELQRLFESSPEGADRTRNILAAKTHQMNLLIKLGRADEALVELPSILEEMRNWDGAPASAEAQVLGLFAEAYRAKENYQKAVIYFSRALSSLQMRGATDENPIFLYSLATVLLQDDDVNGAFAVFSILEKELEGRPRPELMSNFYHLKGKLLSESHDPESIKYLLKSLELDLEAGNNESALVSLLSVMHFAQFSDDRDAILSMVPIMRDFATSSEDPKHLMMVAELEQTVAGWEQEHA